MVNSIRGVVGQARASYAWLLLRPLQAVLGLAILGNGDNVAQADFDVRCFCVGVRVVVVRCGVIAYQAIREYGVAVLCWPYVWVAYRTVV